VRLQGKVCVVTGAASGIGRELVDVFVREGARVAALDRNPSVADGSAQLGLVCDVADEGSVQAAFDAVRGELGPVDALATCAGVALECRFEETPLDAWNHVLAVNLTGSFLCAKHAIPRMEPGGSIVFISSMSALIATADEAAYCASKAGVIGLMRSIAVDCASVPIRSNCICPGVIDTPMNEPMWEERGAEFRRMVEAGHPLGRLGQPADVAQMAAFLASDDSSFVTGAQFVVDGGYTAR
jgi:NAD(P)-dependent dehydrogenase (short-subunit alcohol dehydrogenase family)